MSQDLHTPAAPLVDAAESDDTGQNAAAVTQDTSFVPQLDARQRAMLAEMGVRVWTPQPAAPAAAPEPRQSAARPSPSAASAPAAGPAVAPAAVRPTAAAHPTSTPAVRPSAPAPAPVATAVERSPRPSGIDTMDWPALREAVANCQACALCEKRKNTVFGTGHVQADWFIVGEAPGENEDLQGEPFVGAAGQLLDNMLRAVGRSRHGEGTQGVFSGAWWLGEVLHWQDWAAVALVMVAIASVLWPTRR